MEENKQPELIESAQVNEQVSEQVQEKHEIATVVENKTPIQEFSDNWRMATQLAKSTIIPQTFIGKPENVVIALGLAQQMGLSPFIVMQNLNIIKGKII